MNNIFLSDLDLEIVLSYMDGTVPIKPGSVTAEQVIALRDRLRREHTKRITMAASRAKFEERYEP